MIRDNNFFTGVIHPLVASIQQYATIYHTHYQVSQQRADVRNPRRAQNRAWIVQGKGGGDAETGFGITSTYSPYLRPRLHQYGQCPVGAEIKRKIVYAKNLEIIIDFEWKFFHQIIL